MSSLKVDNWSGLEVSGGRYLVQELLGEGGMAHVYRARDRNLDSDVVLKVPRKAMLEDETFVQRFQGEIRSLVKLRHPHVVSVFDVGIHEGVPFAVMQYLGGGTLLDFYRDTPVSQVLSGLKEWLPPIATAIDFLHSQGFVHRDIKPDNVLFNEHQHAFLSDFGVLKAVLESEEHKKLTITDGVLGTPEYMAPEMCLGESFDGRVDQYALGITVYELLAKRTPFEGQPPGAIMVAQIQREPPLLSEFVQGVPREVIDAIHRGLVKVPDERYGSCTEFATAVLAGPESSLQESRTGAKSDVLDDAHSATGLSSNDDVQNRSDTVVNSRAGTVSVTVDDRHRIPLKKRFVSFLKTLARTLLVLCILASIGGGAYYWLSLPPTWKTVLQQQDDFDNGISALEQRVQEIEQSQSEGSSFLEELEYEDADALRRGWDTHAKEFKVGFGKAFDEATAAHTELSEKLEIYGEQLQSREERFLEKGGAATDGGLAKDRSRLEEYSATLNALKQSLQRCQGLFDRKYDLEERSVIQEINALGDLESAWNSWTHARLSDETLARAEFFASTSKSELLRTRAIAALLQFSTPLTVQPRDVSIALRIVNEKSSSRISSDQELVAKLCYRVLETGKRYDDALSVLVSSDSLDFIPSSRRTSLVQDNPEKWLQRGLFSEVVELCEDEFERFALFEVQCDLKEVQWLNQIREDFREGLLASDQAKVAKLIVKSRWSELYDIPLTLVRSQKLTVSSLDTGFLDDLKERNPQSARTLSRFILGDSDGTYQSWAIEVFIKDGNETELRELTKTPERYAEVLEALCEMNSDAALDLAYQMVRSHYKKQSKIDYGIFDFETVPKELYEKRSKLYKGLIVTSWNSGVPNAKRWASQRLFPEDTVRFYLSLTSSSKKYDQDRRQLKSLLNGAQIGRTGTGSASRGEYSQNSLLSSTRVLAYFDDQETLKADVKKQKKKLEELPQTIEGFKHYSGLKKDIDAMSDYINRVPEYYTKHRRLRYVWQSIVSQRRGNQNSIEPAKYQSLVRAIQDHEETYKDLANLSEGLQWLKE